MTSIALQPRSRLRAKQKLRENGMALCEEINVRPSIISLMHTYGMVRKLIIMKQLIFAQGAIENQVARLKVLR